MEVSLEPAEQQGDALTAVCIKPLQAVDDVDDRTMAKEALPCEPDAGTNLNPSKAASSIFPQHDEPESSRDTFETLVLSSSDHDKGEVTEFSTHPYFLNRVNSTRERPPKKDLRLCHQVQLPMSDEIELGDKRVLDELNALSIELAPSETMSCCTSTDLFSDVRSETINYWKSLADSCCSVGPSLDDEFESLDLGHDVSLSTPAAAAYEGPSSSTLSYNHQKAAFNASLSDYKVYLNSIEFLNASLHAVVKEIEEKRQLLSRLTSDCPLSDIIGSDNNGHQ